MKYLFTAVLCVFVLASLAQNSQIDSLRSVLPMARGNDKIKILIELCWEYRFSNADSARFYGLKALNLAKKAKALPYEVEALHNIGVTHEAQGNYTEALVYEMQALEIRRKIRDDAKTANTFNNIGIIHDEKGDYKEALRYYYSARKIYERLKDQSKIAMVITNIGIVFKEQKEYKKVIISYHEALRIYEKLRDNFGIAACHANLGSVFFELPNYDSALYYSLLATREFEVQNVKQFLAATVCNAGMAYHELGMTAMAKEFLLRALKLNEEYDNKKELSFVLIRLADIYKDEGQLQKALTNAQRGLDLAEKIDALEQVMQARKVIAEVKAASHDFKGAYHEQQQYDVVKDSLFKTEKTKQIAELQTQYETEKKENQIQLLKQENEIKDFGLRQDRLFILGLILVVLSLIIFGYLWRNRTKLKQNIALETTRAQLREKQLEAVIASQEAERKRFAADLHDGLGQMISAVRLGLSKENPEQHTVNNALTLLHEMNGEIRNIAFNLMPQILMNGGLEEALKEFALRINRTDSILIHVQAFDFHNEMSLEKKIALYRICQEWVNNVMKYSGCKRVNIQLVQHSEELVITIDDDGNGFDPHILHNGHGNGWRNINSRVGVIKGEIEVDSKYGRQGTLFTITAPIYATIL
jgi:two-component system, NarL family, sensor kinase